MQLATIFELMYYCSQKEDSLEKLKRELEIESDHTIIDWHNFCRDICVDYYVKNPQRVGGHFLSGLRSKRKFF